MISLAQIQQVMRESVPYPVEVTARFSVFIPLIVVEGELHLLYEKRASTLRNQPGEISFPGGRVEEDESPEQAAVRETAEELLLPENKITLFGEGDFLVSPYHSVIYTFVGQIQEEFSEITPSTDEVERCFTVPLSYFLTHEPKKYETKVERIREKNFPYELIPGGKQYPFKGTRETTYFYQYEEEVIWGFTAKMTYQWIQQLKQKR